MTCSLYPEGNWKHCCREHDLALNSGKPWMPAHRKLRNCVRKAGHPIHAQIMYIGVVIGFPVWAILKNPRAVWRKIRNKNGT